jgi:hypothetical protein
LVKLSSLNGEPAMSANSGPPRRRESPVEEGSTQRVVD